MKKHQEELLQAEFICPTCGRHLAWALLSSSINCPDCGTWVNKITYNKLRKLISKKLDIETTIAYN